MVGGRSARFRGSAATDTRRLRSAAGRDGSGDRVFRLPAGYSANQRHGRKARRGAFYDHRRAFQGRGGRMTMARTKQEIAEANRRRYQALRGAGKELTPKSLPEAAGAGRPPV